MTQKVCPQCGAPVAEGAVECEYCGKRFIPVDPNEENAESLETAASSDGIDPSWPVRDKVIAALFAIFLGGLGLHKFYLGKTGKGILYLLFVWTGIPSFIGFIEGITYLCSDDKKFMLKHKCRLPQYV